MIGKVTLGASFYHTIAYCLEDKRQLSDLQKQQLSSIDGLQHTGRAEVLEYNNCYGDKWELTEQFKDVKKLSTRVEKPVIHLTLRAAPGDQLTREQWVAIGQAAAQEFGIDKNQYICVLHWDTKQPHIHVVGNRVGYDGKVAKDSNSYARMATLCRTLEKKYQLNQVLSPRKFLSPKDRQIPRHDGRKELLKENIREALIGTRDYPSFEKKIQEKGYRVDKGRGIAFEDEKKVWVKGSEVGYSLATIERILAQNERAALRQIPANPPNNPSSIDRTKNTRIDNKAPSWNYTTNGLFKELATQGNDLLTELLKPIPQGQAGDPQWEEEERRRKRKKKKLRH